LPNSGKSLIWVNFWEFFLVKFDQKQWGLFIFYFCFTSATIKKFVYSYGRPQLSTIRQKSKQMSYLEICFASMNWTLNLQEANLIGSGFVSCLPAQGDMLVKVISFINLLHQHID
jgi:hypothetical protein